MRRSHLLVLVALLATACGSGSTAGAPTAHGPITVFAAASLTEAFGDLQAGAGVRYSFGGSGALVTQIQQGAPADVVATADVPTMQRLFDAGLVEPPGTFATNALEILVAPGNPKAVHGLADLAGADLKVVLADDSVPAGKYAAQALQAAGTSVRPVSKETDVKAAVAKVTLGEADATIVYVTDVLAAGAKGQGVPIPPAANVVAEYRIAVVKATGNHDGATAFVDRVLGAAGQDALRRRGFAPGPAPGPR
jgi:molybdate transport system substrate-binding protein